MMGRLLLCWSLGAILGGGSYSRSEGGAGGVYRRRIWLGREWWGLGTLRRRFDSISSGLFLGVVGYGGFFC